MPGGWAGSNRKDRLPSWWPVTVRRIIARDPWCRCTGCPKCFLTTSPSTEGCRRPSREADHIERGDDHRDANLRGICSQCHGFKSSQEGNQAKAEKKAPTGFFEEPPPGRLW